LKYLVLDASCAIGWMVDNPTPRLALRALQLLQSGSIGVVPDLWHYEITNALVVAERRGRVSAQVVSGHINDIERLAAFLELSAATPSSLVTAARQSGLSAYDAAYFELASRRNLPLATLDEKLRAAAQKSGIELIR